MTKPLASYYGVLGATTDAFTRVELDPARRVGLLTQGGFLARHAGFDRNSVVRRGLFVRERLLCRHLPPPPQSRKFENCRSTP
jgi:hypothetical protein